MNRCPARNVSELLQAWGNGDQSVLDELVPLVYHELHRLAHSYMRRETPGHLLQTTAIVNEAFLRLTGAQPPHCRDQAHFLTLCARLMRRILVDFARAEQSQKRGGKAIRLDPDRAPLTAWQPDQDLVALDEALTALAAADPRKGRVVELRFFGGLSVAETAEVLGVSTDTVTRDWKLAKALILREMKHE